MAKHNELGVEGEKIAVEFLKQSGYSILETNWRFEKNEIDILAQKNSLVVVVEVKCRSTDLFGNPEESVTPAKQKKLIEAADRYLQTLDWEAEVRYDIISIILSEKKSEIHHIEEAFRPIAE